MKLLAYLLLFALGVVGQTAPSSSQIKNWNQVRYDTYFYSDLEPVVLDPSTATRVRLEDLRDAGVWLEDNGSTLVVVKGSAGVVRFRAVDTTVNLTSVQVWRYGLSGTIGLALRLNLDPTIIPKINLWEYISEVGKEGGWGFGDGCNMPDYTYLPDAVVDIVNGTWIIQSVGHPTRRC